MITHSPFTVRHMLCNVTARWVPVPKVLQYSRSKAHVTRLSYSLRCFIIICDEATYCISVIFFKVLNFIKKKANLFFYALVSSSPIFANYYSNPCNTNC